MSDEPTTVLETEPIATPVTSEGPVPATPVLETTETEPVTSGGIPAPVLEAPKSPIILVADQLLKNVPDRMEEAYFRMEFAADIAKHMVETASIAFNSYVIPGYANKDSVPLLMAAALLTVWPEGFEFMDTYLIDNLPYMDADTVSHLAKSVMDTTADSTTMGVYSNPFEILVGGIQMARLRGHIEKKNVDEIINWITSSELSLNTFAVSRERFSTQILLLAKDHPKCEVAYAWVIDDEPTPDEPADDHTPNA